jgi:23S rRNA (pseudouridine1915-N3)-methyltransferase
MKIQLWSIGKAHDANMKGGIDEFSKRLNRYHVCEWKIIAPPKNAAALSELALKKEEGKIILNALQADDYLLMLDEYGKQLSSMQLAAHLEKLADNGTRNLVLLIGGAFGIDEAVRKRANFVWSLSPLTFPHQLVRLILAEQLYRACTINKNEKYHHQ